MTPERDKRAIIAELLRGHDGQQRSATSADAILNALHQGGWEIRPRAAYVAVFVDRGDFRAGYVRGPFATVQDAEEFAVGLGAMLADDDEAESPELEAIVLPVVAP